MLPSQTFYFGQSPPKYKHLAPPSAPPTAIGKVKHNEALSQPFRQHPRHDQRKSSNTLPKLNSVPKPNENDPKIVIVSGRQAADNDVTLNNNQTSMRNLNSSSKLPPKERDQEEVNREFMSELMRAKAKLSKVGGGTNAIAHGRREGEQAHAAGLHQQEAQWNKMSIDNR